MSSADDQDSGTQASKQKRPDITGLQPAYPEEEILYMQTRPDGTFAESSTFGLLIEEDLGFAICRWCAPKRCARRDADEQPHVGRARGTCARATNATSTPRSSEAPGT